MSSTNRSNNRAGNKAANNSGSKSSAQADGSKSSAPKTEKQQQEDLVHALKPDWTTKEIQDFCSKYNYDAQKINDALENAFQDERPGHQDADWQDVSHKRVPKKKDEEKSPVSGRGRGGFPARGGRGAGRGGAEFTRGAAAGRGRGGARGGAVVASNGVSESETSPSERGGRGRGRGGAVRGGRGAARGGRPGTAESKEVKEVQSPSAASAAPVPVPAPMGAWASKPVSILGVSAGSATKEAKAAPAAATPAPAAAPATESAAPAAAPAAASTTTPTAEAPATATTDAAAAPATSPAPGSSLPARKQRPRKERKEPAATTAAAAASGETTTSAASTQAATSPAAAENGSNVNFGSVGSGSLGVSVAAPEQQAPATTPSSKQQQDPIGPSRRNQQAWRPKAGKAETTTPTAAASTTSPAAAAPAAEAPAQPQGFSISHTSFPTEPVEMPRAIASVSHGFSGVSFGFDPAAAARAAASSKAVAAPTSVPATTTPATSAFSSTLGPLPSEFTQPAVSQPAPQTLSHKLDQPTTTSKRGSAGAVGAASTQATQATQTFGAQANLYSQAAGAGVFSQQPQANTGAAAGYRAPSQLQYSAEQYMNAGYDDQSNNRSLYGAYDQNYSYGQPFQQGFYGQSNESGSSPRGATTTGKPARGSSSRQQQGLKKDDQSAQGQQAPVQATESSSPQVGPVDTPSSESPVPVQQQQTQRKPRQQQQPQMQGGYEQGYQQKPQQPYGNAGPKPYNPNKPSKYNRERQAAGNTDNNLGPSQFPALGAQGYAPTGPQSGSYGQTGGKGKNSPQQQNAYGGQSSKFNKNQTPQQQQPQSFMPAYGMPYGYYPPYGMPYGAYTGPQSPQFAPAPYARGQAGPYGYPGYAAAFGPGTFPGGHVSPTGFEDYSKDYGYQQQDMMMQQGVETQNGADTGLGMGAQDNQGYDATAWQGQWQPQPPVMEKPTKEKSGGPSQGSSKASGNQRGGAAAPNMQQYPGYNQNVDYSQSFQHGMYQNFQPPFDQQQQQQQPQQQQRYNQTQWNA